MSREKTLDQFQNSTIIENSESNLGGFNHSDTQSLCNTHYPSILLSKQNVTIYVYKSDNEMWFEYEDTKGRLSYRNKKYCQFMSKIENTEAY